MTTSRRRRRTRRDLEELDRALLDIVRENYPLGVRQAFYSAVKSGLVPKNEAYAGYGVVQRRLLLLRRSGAIPHAHIIDESRVMMGRPAYGDLLEFAEAARDLYRRDLWNGASLRVQVWCEKLSVAGVIHQVTDRQGVNLYPARGFAGEHFLWEAAEEIKALWRNRRQRTVALFVGDWDPSGSLIDQDIKRRLEGFGAGEALQEFRRVAVTPAQIRDLQLPTRPTKRLNNRHARQFEGDSVEVEAIPPVLLRNLLENEILAYLDPGRVDRIRKIEEEELKALYILPQQLSQRY